MDGSCGQWCFSRNCVPRGTIANFKIGKMAADQDPTRDFDRLDLTGEPSSVSCRVTSLITRQLTLLARLTYRFKLRACEKIVPLVSVEKATLDHGVALSHAF